MFYYGISLFELSKYEEAIVQFNKSLNKYPQFSDAQYYKAISLNRLGNLDDAMELLEIAKKGYTINDDNTDYKRYPYQVRW